MASIARKNLLEDIPRFLVAQAGIIFAVSLVTIQLGILRGFTRSTSLLIDQSTADIWISSEEILHFELTQPIPAERLAQAQEMEGVARAEAIALYSGRWRSPSGKIAPSRIIGYNPEGQLFRLWDMLEGDQLDLKQPQSVAVDESNLATLEMEALGEEASINSIAVRLSGITRGTQSIVSSLFLFTSLENAKAYAAGGLTSTVRCTPDETGSVSCTTVFERVQDNLGGEDETITPEIELEPLNITDPISYVLIQAEPGQDIAELQQRLEAEMPDIRAHTREELSTLTRNHWQNSTGVGFILGLGATVGVVVGIVVVGQILYSSVSDHLREFGTLKAMGASDWVIYSIIMEQAMWMAVLGYIPSMALCLGLGAWTFATQGIIILITPIMGVGIFGLTVAMCVGSALFAIQKVTRVDPAIVFKA
ncbi:FtsX-like permease family protein [Leptolyngbya sp. CCY15150]|uniref:FtsX-like permease family protein n=1 Tax=Leptolyngbya sp. CCY15150 TaxID=2767772 RepID=UPI00194DE5A9|nr:FtsX-like permease family protein [Leptolyngbya sp. CCY15150]